MAQEDLKQLFELEKDISIMNKVLECIPILEKAVSYKLRRLTYDISKEVTSAKEDIELQKKYSLCKHSNLNKDVFTGSDSHKDYYEDNCKDCGKTIKEYSI